MMHNKWKSRDGEKVWSRNLLANGAFFGPPRIKASSVASLVGYDEQNHVGCKCIHQGIEQGYIKPTASIWGIENNKRLAQLLREYQGLPGLKVFEGDVSQFPGPPKRKLDTFILDLMCGPNLWIGEYLADKVVHMMKRRSGIGINVCVQHFRPGSSPKQYPKHKEILMENMHKWKPIWYRRLQGGEIAEMDSPLLFSGVRCFGSCMPAWAGIHYFMEKTDFLYSGCYRYYERSSNKSTGVNYMLSMRYERGFARH